MFMPRGRMSSQLINAHEVEALVAAGHETLTAESVPVSTEYFRVGTPLQLTVSQKGQVRSAYSVLLGYRAGRFLLVELPSVGGRALVITSESAVRVRYLLEGRLLGFSCESLKVQFSPEKLLFLNYPRRVDQLALRRHERVRVSVPTLLRIGDAPQQLKAETRDLSVSGCGVLMPHDGVDLQTGVKLTLYLQPRGDSTLYKARAWVRTVKARRDGAVWLGCEFDFKPGEEETRTMVERMVLARTGMMSTSDLDPST